MLKKAFRLQEWKGRLIHLRQKHGATAASHDVYRKSRETQECRNVAVVRASPVGQWLVAPEDLNSIRRCSKPVACSAQDAGFSRRPQAHVSRGDAVECKRIAARIKAERTLGVR